MIAARQIAFGKAAGARGLSAKDYIQDGLVAMWDGIENGGFGVHNEGPTTEFPWIDCITGQSFSSGEVILCNDGIAASDTYSINSIRFPDELVGAEEATVEYVVSFANGVSNASFIRGDDISRIYYPQLTMVSANIVDGIALRAGAYNSAVALSGVGAGVSNERLRVYSFFTMSKKNMLNEFGAGVGGGLVKKSTNKSSYIFPFPTSTWRFGDYGAIDTSNNLLPSRVLAVRGSNRALTAEEIAYNYNIDKQRFGLP